MKKLIIIRHSFAESGSSAQSDFERNLTAVGKKVALNQAKVLMQNKLNPNIIITSSADRALQTSHLFNEVLNPQRGIKEISLLYSDYTTAEFFHILNNIDSDIEIAAIVGHNPSVSAMASRLDPDSFLGFKPCSMAVFNIPSKWSKLQVGDAKIEHYFSS